MAWPWLHTARVSNSLSEMTREYYTGACGCHSVAHVRICMRNRADVILVYPSLHRRYRADARPVSRAWHAVRTTPFRCSTPGCVDTYTYPHILLQPHAGPYSTVIISDKPDVHLVSPAEACVLLQGDAMHLQGDASDLRSRLGPTFGLGREWATTEFFRSNLGYRPVGGVGQ